MLRAHCAHLGLTRRPRRAQVTVTGPNYRPRPHDLRTFAGRSPPGSLDPGAPARPSPKPTLGAQAASLAAAAKAATAADAAARARAPGNTVGGARGAPGAGLGPDDRAGSGAAAALLGMLGGGALGAVRAPAGAPVQVRRAGRARRALGVPIAGLAHVICHATRMHAEWTPSGSEQEASGAPAIFGWAAGGAVQRGTG
jgi:hypothetical protein